jgi:intracellular sulfur oxidation DsrE/DsrF family protein
MSRASGGGSLREAEVELLIIIEDPREDEAIAAIRETLEAVESLPKGIAVVVYGDAVSLLSSQRFLEALHYAASLGASILVVEESLESRGASIPVDVERRLNISVITKGRLKEIEESAAVVVKQGVTCPYSVRDSIRA